jgi:hypothetical protein
MISERNRLPLERFRRCKDILFFHFPMHVRTLGMRLQVVLSKYIYPMWRPRCLCEFRCRNAARTLNNLANAVTKLFSLFAFLHSRSPLFQCFLQCQIWSVIKKLFHSLIFRLEQLVVLIFLIIPLLTWRGGFSFFRKVSPS